MQAQTAPLSWRMLRPEDETETIRRLRQELRRLRIEEYALANRLAPMGRLPECLGITRRAVRRAMRCLLSLDWITLEAMAVSCSYDEGGEPTADLKFVDYLVFSCRQALAPHGIEIETRPRRGCRMSPINKAKVLRLCISESEATGRNISEYTRVDMKAYVWMPPGFRKTARMSD